MDDLGIMVYGFAREEAHEASEVIGKALDRQVLVLSASGREDDMVRDILENPADLFERKDMRVLMFLGFEGDEIRRSLAAFPRTMNRPIFCGLTEHNITWKFRDLAEHLREEHEKATGRK